MNLTKPLPFMAQLLGMFVASFGIMRLLVGDAPLGISLTLIGAYSFYVGRKHEEAEKNEP